MMSQSTTPLLYGYIQKLQHIGESWQTKISNLGQELLITAEHIPSSLTIEKLTCYLLIAILFWCCVGWILDDIQSQISPSATANGFDPEEFDYLSSNEAIPAKFNLVEAYIQMNDFESASKVLVEIIAQGNKEQREHAMELLDGIS